MKYLKFFLLLFLYTCRKTTCSQLGLPSWKVYKMRWFRTDHQASRRHHVRRSILEFVHNKNVTNVCECFDATLSARDNRDEADDL